MTILEIRTRIHKRIEHLDKTQLRKLDSMIEREFSIQNHIDKEPFTERPIGLRKGALKYMADDFDAPLDCFKEYMPD